MTQTLNMIKVGQNAVIKQLKNEDKMKRRLFDIGLIEGTKVECVTKSPSGDPAAFSVRGAVIALRSEDSKNIVVDLEG